MTVLGQLLGDHAITQDGAELGDVIAVSGNVGIAAASEIMLVDGKPYQGSKGWESFSNG